MAKMYNNVMNEEQKVIFNFLMKKNNIVTTKNAYLGDLYNNIIALRECQNLAYDWPIYSKRKRLGRLAVYTKRAIRRLSRFLVEPIKARQSKYNIVVVNTLEILIEHNNSLKEEILNLKMQLTSLVDKNIKKRAAEE
jgi:hypothetical protein